MLTSYFCRFLLMCNTNNFIFQSHILASVNSKYSDSSLWFMYEHQQPHLTIASGIHVAGSTKGTHLSSWQEYKNIKGWPLWFIIVLFFFVLRQCWLQYVHYNTAWKRILMNAAIKLANKRCYTWLRFTKYHTEEFLASFLITLVIIS